MVLSLDIKHRKENINFTIVHIILLYFLENFKVICILTINNKAHIIVL